MNEKEKAGSIRVSQAIWSAGPGATIDLPNFSVVPLGLEHWGSTWTRNVDEPRLLRIVQRMKGDQVDGLRQPAGAEEGGEIPVAVFPGWLRCTRCNLLAEASSGNFRLKKHRDPTRTKYVHDNCPGNSGYSADVVPARFMVACEHGHLDDFPWHWYVHGGESECRGPLEFFEARDSLQTQNLYVACRGCGKKKSMALAFGERARETLPACRGRHPHLPDRSPDRCDAELRAVLLGASNVWFSVTRSSLALPEPSMSGLEGIVRREWDAFEPLGSRGELIGAFAYLKKRFPELETANVDDAWEAISAVRSKMEPESNPDDLLLPEWKTLTRVRERLEGGPDFLARRVEAPRGFEEWIDSVVLLERLREVTVLLGFTRLEPPGDWNPENPPSWAPLTDEPPRWLPANEVRGEGIFVRFQERAIRDWLNRPAVRKRDDLLAKAQRAWNEARGKEGASGYPGIRYALLHTFSHLLLRELAMESGYSAASIKERIYAQGEGEGEAMAGVLLYTAAADSDGTLGGLVRLGRPEVLAPMMERALDRAGVCAADPLCLEHDPGMDGSLHGAACHSCAFVSETSCESGNRYLDRALVVPLWGHEDAALFGNRR